MLDESEDMAVGMVDIMHELDENVDDTVVDIIEEKEAVRWVCEIEAAVADEDAEGQNFAEEEAWDDVNGGELDAGDVREARKEEVEYMESRRIWDVKPTSECWDKLGKAPVGVRWVDSRKSSGVRSRLVARDFKGKDNDRDDLFAATPPLEGIRLLLSRAATVMKHGRTNKLMFIDAKKAHLNPKCDEDVYIELPAEAVGGQTNAGN